LRGCQTRVYPYPSQLIFRLPTRPYPNWITQVPSLSCGCKQTVSHRDAAHWGGLQESGEHCYTARHATATYRAPPRLTSHTESGQDWNTPLTSACTPLFPAQLLGSGVVQLYELVDITTTRPLLLPSFRVCLASDQHYLDARSRFNTTTDTRAAFLP
jgi:hypothetical protein